MATDPDFIIYVGEQAGLGPALTWRKMFGEYAIYLHGKVVGFACDNQLFVKPTDAGRTVLGQVRDGFPYPGAKPHFLVDAALDDRELVQRLLLATAEALPTAKPKAAPKPKTTPKLKTAPKAKSAGIVAGLGPKSRQMLADAGIVSDAAMRKLGAVGAYVKVKRSGANASLNLLWALEGALTGEPWQTVARDHRASLLLALEEAQHQTRPKRSGKS